MKKKICITIGLLAIMMVTLAYAGNIVTKEVYNSTFNIRLNGALYTPQSQILSYDGRTYLQLREFANITNNEVDFINDEIIVNTKDEYAIDAAYTKALAAAVTTADMREAANTYAEAWKQEMEKYYNEIYEGATDEEKQTLVESQQKWNEFVESNLKLDSALDISAGGTLGGVNYTYSVGGYNRERAIQLKGLCYEGENL